MRDSALLDSDPVVRHEATLALGAYSQRALARRNRPLLEYIAREDRSSLVRDTARVALRNLQNYR